MRSRAEPHAPPDLRGRARGIPRLGAPVFSEGDRSACARAGASRVTSIAGRSPRPESRGICSCGPTEEYGGRRSTIFATSRSSTKRICAMATPASICSCIPDLVGALHRRPGHRRSRRPRWLPACAGGEKILAMAMTEPGAGSDLAGMQEHAEDRGDHWLLNGSKTYISNGQLADLVIVAARTVPDQRYGIGLFVVEADMAGFRARPTLAQDGPGTRRIRRSCSSTMSRSEAQRPWAIPTQGFAYLGAVPGRRAPDRGHRRRGAGADRLRSDAWISFSSGAPSGARRHVPAQPLRHGRLRAQIDAIQTFVDQMCAGSITRGA